MARRHRGIPKNLRNPAEKPAPTFPRQHFRHLSQQALNNSYDRPMFYRDFMFNCIDCGSLELDGETAEVVVRGCQGPDLFRRTARRACRRKFRESHRGTPRRSHAERQQKEKAIDSSRTSPLAVPGLITSGCLSIPPS